MEPETPPGDEGAVIRAVAARAAGSSADADDLGQELWLRFVRTGGPSLRGDGQSRSWFKAVARNVVRDEWRRRSRDESVIASQVIPEDASAEDQALRRAEGRAVRNAFASLSADEQAVLRLRIVERYSSASVGAMTGRSAVSVRQLQRRAVAKLAQQLSAAGWLEPGAQPAGGRIVGEGQQRHRRERGQE